jgi:hypothetical protein
MSLTCSLSRDLPCRTVKSLFSLFSFPILRLPPPQARSRDSDIPGAGSSQLEGWIRSISLTCNRRGSLPRTHISVNHRTDPWASRTKKFAVA